MIHLKKFTAVTLSMGILAVCHSVPVWAADNPDRAATEDSVRQPATPDGLESLQDQSSRAPNGKVRVALTLAGGGARAVAHIGVLKVLEEEGIRPDFIAGSSMGALIGCLYASGMSAAEIERLALDGSMRKAFFPVPLQVQTMMYVPKYFLLRMLTFHPDIGIYSGKALARFMEKNLPENMRNLEQMKIPVAVTATNLVDTSPVWLTKGNIGDAVRASCAVPMLYRPVKRASGNGNGNGHDDLILVDGGIRENLPTEVAKAAGAPLVVAVKLHSYLDKIPEKDFDTNFSYMDRITSIFMSEIESNAVAKANVLIEPKVRYMHLHSFDTNSLKQVIDAGETAARAAMPRLKKLLGAEATASAPVVPQ